MEQSLLSVRSSSSRPLLPIRFKTTAPRACVVVGLGHQNGDIMRVDPFSWTAKHGGRNGPQFSKESRHVGTGTEAQSGGSHWERTAATAVVDSRLSLVREHLCHDFRALRDFVRRQPGRGTAITHGHPRRIHERVDP